MNESAGFVSLATGRSNEEEIIFSLVFGYLTERKGKKKGKSFGMYPN